MEDPANEIKQVFSLILAADNPDIQREAVLKYVTTPAVTLGRARTFTDSKHHV